MPVVGFLSSASPPDTYDVSAFRQGMSENGYVEGRNVAIEYHFVEGDYVRLPELVADLVRRKVAAIAALGVLPVVLAARAGTTTIPIVFGIGGDPLRLGLVASLSRPGGNLTGATLLNTEVLPKRLELLHELVPTAAKIAFLVNPTILLPRSNRETRERGPASWDCSSMSCTRAPNARWMQPSQP
jgi:putative ABC transport system substrate-binding protein